MYWVQTAELVILNHYRLIYANICCMQHNSIIICIHICIHIFILYLQCFYGVRAKSNKYAIILDFVVLIFCVN